MYDFFIKTKKIYNIEHEKLKIATRQPNLHISEIATPPITTISSRTNILQTIINLEARRHL